MASESAPEFDGQCAFAVCLGKKGVAGKESCYSVKDGKKYLFSNPVAKFLFSVLPGCRKKADANWSPG